MTLNTFNFNDKDREEAELSKKNHNQEIELVEKRLELIREEIPRLPNVGLEVTKTLLENLIESSIERIRLLNSEIFFADIVINSKSLE